MCANAPRSGNQSRRSRGDSRVRRPSPVARCIHWRRRIDTGKHTAWRRPGRVKGQDLGGGSGSPSTPSPSPSPSPSAESHPEGSRDVRVYRPESLSHAHVLFFFPLLGQVTQVFLLLSSSSLVSFLRTRRLRERDAIDLRDSRRGEETSLSRIRTHGPRALAERSRKRKIHQARSTKGCCARSFHRRKRFSRRDSLSRARENSSRAIANEPVDTPLYLPRPIRSRIDRCGSLEDGRRENSEGEMCSGFRPGGDCTDLVRVRLGRRHCRDPSTTLYRRIHSVLCVYIYAIYTICAEDFFKSTQDKTRFKDLLPLDKFASNCSLERKFCLLFYHLSCSVFYVYSYSNIDMYSPLCFTQHL